MKELETIMDEYAPIATKSSRIFFVLDTLEIIHYLDSYSLFSYGCAKLCN